MTFTLGNEVMLDPGTGDDGGAEFVVLATDGDDRADRLRAGEAVSAAWLAAVGEGTRPHR
ncbi:hypothetical protein ACPPVO_21365 [Dactylosporangium sp. McL0621]|uniref:hypothetical protein n=1 Tax=Dactylosporangium sp. McL0621 TaxID=3415678 RepID=UPI003CEFDF16